MEENHGWMRPTWGAKDRRNQRGEPRTDRTNGTDGTNVENPGQTEPMGGRNQRGEAGMEGGWREGMGMGVRCWERLQGWGVSVGNAFLRVSVPLVVGDICEGGGRGE